MRLAPALALTLAACASCGRPAPTGSVLSASAPSATSAPPSTPPSALPSPPATAVAPLGCNGLEKTECVLREGCILDQPGAGLYVCRAGRNRCELAARHGHVIGPDVKGVSDADARRAAEICAATTGCVIAGGRCSCACHVFGDCDCSCGGGWLARCTPAAGAESLEGFPGRL